MTQPTSGMFEAEEHARERDRLRRLDRRDRVRRADLAEAFELEQLLGGEPVQLGDRAHELLLPEPPHGLLADAVDVGRAPSPSCSASRGRATGTRGSGSGASPRPPASRPRRRRAGSASASRTASSRAGACPAGPTTCGITSPARWTITSSPSRMSLRLMSSSLCSVAREIVTPPTSTGSSTAHGLSAAGAADADADLVQARHRGHRRPLERTRPARALVQGAEPALLVVRVDLDDDAVDLVVELRAAKLPCAAALGDLLDRLDALARTGSCGSRARAATAASPSATRGRCPRAGRCRRPRSRAAAAR